jgi:cysteine desulfurase
MLKSNKPVAKNARNIYLDYAASAMPNPSSIHRVGAETKKKLEKARRETADILGARPGEIVFTSGGTESNNLAIQGLVYAFSGAGFLPHIITTNIEHPSVLETCELLVKRGLAGVSVVPVEANGIVDPKKIKKEIKANTVLVSVMYANNEIGTIQPIGEIAKEINKKLKEKNFLSSSEKTRRLFQNSFLLPFFHTDAVQGINYLDLNVAKLGVDMLSLSGSKVEGGGRVGLLYKRSSVPLENVWGGGDQEFGFRPGTENWPEILKFTKAFTQAQKIKEKESARLLKLRNLFFDELQHSEILKNVGMLVNGDRGKRLPNNVNITIPYTPSDLLVIELSARGIMASSKSACKSSKADGSYVIQAIRPDEDKEIGGLRFSFGRNTTKEDVTYAVKSLGQILKKLERWYN